MKKKRRRTNRKTKLEFSEKKISNMNLMKMLVASLNDSEHGLEGGLLRRAFHHNFFRSLKLKGRFVTILT